MDERSRTEIHRRGDEYSFSRRVPTIFSKERGTVVVPILLVGVLVIGGTMAIGSSSISILLGYIMPMNLAVIFARAIPALLLILVLIGGELFLRPKPPSPAERDRVYSLKGETLEEIKELIDFNLRTGNREKANEWAKKALELTNSNSVPKIDKKS